MDFSMTDEELAVVEAATQIAGDNNPWMALVDGGWGDLLLEDPDRGLGYLGLVAEGLGAAGASVPLVGTAVVFPSLFTASAGGRRVAVADRVLGDRLAEDGGGATECLVVLDEGHATAHE